MLWSSSLLSFCLFQLAAASPSVKRWEDFQEKHAWVEVPHGWTFHSTPPPEYLIDLRLGLKEGRLDELIAALHEVSDPTHVKYGQHLSKEDVNALIAPRPSTVAAVDSWLLHHELPAIATTEGAGDWVTIRVPIAQAERMLNAKYSVYEHSKTAERVVRTLAYSLPRELHEHINVVTPTTYFSTLRSMRTTSFLQPEIKPLSLDTGANAKALAPEAIPAASCASTITPTCLRTLYNTTGYVPVSTATNRLGVAGYLNEYANRADLQTFATRFRPDAVGVTYQTITLNGGLDDQSDPGVEANLDIQYTIGMSYPTPNTYWSTGGSPPFIPDSQTPTNTNEPYLEWIQSVLSAVVIPQTITTSYGDDEQTVPQDYAVSVCNLFAQLGARGSTVLFSSGDFGVGGGNCLTNDGTSRRLFQPAFPASCPFVTAVGGTRAINPEVGVSFSGGGFSRYFTQPSYQASAVSTFLSALGTTHTGLYNATGRAYPDLAAQGSGFQVVIGGRVGSVGGTSASSPTVAGIIALVNDVRLSQNKTSLGFLNPLIYANPSAFNDILSGSNPGCSTTGFTARAGWDPVTGLGTPDFLKLRLL